MRSKFFLTGLGAGYGLILANVVYTLVSIPLALHYLAKDQFGLWALILQIVGYLGLLDLGISGSTGRVLVDFKDDRTTGHYGSVLKCAALVFLVQGFVAVAVVFVVTPYLPGWLNIPADLMGDFKIVLYLQVGLFICSLVGKTFSLPLQAQQRLDIVYSFQIVGMAISLISLWVGFHLGLGMYSLVLSSFTSFMANTLPMAILCIRLNYWPAKGDWGKVNKTQFRELFSFGWDVLLMQTGWQILQAVPLLIISRVLGLDAAANWSVGTKLFTMALQFVGRIFDSAASALAEIYVRKEDNLMRLRLFQLVQISGILGASAGGVLMAGNSDFVLLWTHGKIEWQRTTDIWMGLLLVLYSLSKCHVGLTGQIKQIRGVRWIYFLESFFFVSIWFFAGSQWGITGVAFALVMAHLASTFGYGLFRTARFFDLRIYAVASLCNVRPFVLFMVNGVIAFSAVKVLSTSSLPIRVVFEFILTGSFGLILAWTIGFSPAVKNELTGRFRQALRLNG